MFSILRPYIFSLDPEVAHDLAIKSLKLNLTPNFFDENKDSPIFQTDLFGKKIDKAFDINMKMHGDWKDLQVESKKSNKRKK